MPDGPCLELAGFGGLAVLAACAIGCVSRASYSDCSSTKVTSLALFLLQLSSRSKHLPIKDH